jgi:hypothetical protein
MAAAPVMSSEYQTPVTLIEDQHRRPIACPRGEAVSRLGGGSLLHVAPARQHVAAAALAERAAGALPRRKPSGSKALAEKPTVSEPGTTDAEALTCGGWLPPEALTVIDRKSLATPPASDTAAPMNRYPAAVVGTFASGIFMPT